MKINANLLLILTFLLSCGINEVARAETKSIWHWFDWSYKHDVHRQYKEYNPYLEDVRHLQIPQWEENDWYAEDWLLQRDGMELVRGFYATDIIRNQFVRDGEVPVLVVGPNFYRLSGYDKRRVVHVIDVVYGYTASSESASFELEDWNTTAPIGTFDQNGLRLH